VAVLLYDPDIDHLVFIEQFRIGAFAALASPWFESEHQSPWLLECVAGIIEPGETPEDVAIRECLEEANCEVLDLVPMTHYFASPGGTSESIFLYCGRTDASHAGGIHGLDAEHEDLRVLSVPTETALAWLDEGRFTNAMTLIAMQWFKLNRNDLRPLWAPS
jgi:ADP-ribose pyrophosphatase